MYAIVALGGKQYRMEPGKEVLVESTNELKNVEIGNDVSIDNILFINQDGAVKVGTPVVAGAKIDATILEHGKNKKIRVETYKKRKGSKKAYGHRQPFIRLKVNQIQAG